MVDRILATISMLMFLGFLGFLAVNIAKVNLWVIVVVVGAMAVFDFVKTLREDAATDEAGLSSHERAVQALEDQDQAG
jgi:mannose/fructose/N-acetylgalactosamine-specific phosphotransferase system component IIC